ncbi:hypothetical protein NQZ68_008576 [Dissostichus eleginoides]|nr:hypothetical protein NQZ68_008576 [Dissostichus eleginoides]
METVFLLSKSPSACHRVIILAHSSPLKAINKHKKGKLVLTSTEVDCCEDWVPVDGGDTVDVGTTDSEDRVLVEDKGGTTDRGDRVLVKDKGGTTDREDRVLEDEGWTTDREDRVLVEDEGGTTVFTEVRRASQESNLESSDP